LIIGTLQKVIVLKGGVDMECGEEYSEQLPGNAKSSVKGANSGGIPSKADIDLLNLVTEMHPFYLVDDLSRNRTSIEDTKPSQGFAEAKVTSDVSKTRNFVRKAEERIREELKHRIKRAAMDRHFNTTVNAPILGGETIDVSIENSYLKIGCQIADKSDVKKDLNKVATCLSMGYVKVIVCTQEKKELETIARAFNNLLPEQDLRKVMVVGLNGLIEYLDDITAVDEKGGDYIRGRRVKVEFKVVSPETAEEKSNTIKRVLGKYSNK